MHGVMDGMEPLFCDVGALALTPSNADRGAEEGAEGNTVATFPALPYSLVLSLSRDSENHGAR